MTFWAGAEGQTSMICGVRHDALDGVACCQRRQRRQAIPISRPRPAPASALRPGGLLNHIDDKLNEVRNRGLAVIDL